MCIAQRTPYFPTLLRLPLIMGALLASSLLGGCLFNSGSSDGGDADAIESYSPLAVGNITQLVHASNGKTVRMEIVGETQRTDGRRVFVEEWTDGTGAKDSSYYFMSGGFLVSTAVDSLAEAVEGNPFGEHRVAMMRPGSGKAWEQSHTDPEQVRVGARQVDSLVLPAGTFHDVYAYDLFSQRSTYEMTVFYAPEVGFVGSALSDSTSMDWKLVYAKVREREWGNPAGG